MWARTIGSAVLSLVLCASGCQWAVDDADREVYRLIESRQRAAIARTTDVHIDQPRWPEWEKPFSQGPDEKYSFVPHPVDSDVPAAFRLTATQPATAATNGAAHDAPAVATTQPVAEVPATQPAQPSAQNTQTTAGVEPPAMAPAADVAAGSQPAGEIPVLSLGEALEYAFRHAREFQTAKEELYLAALALSLERHLWTPQLVGDIRTRYANYGAIRDFDHAMDVVATTAVEQKLPFGGEVTASVIGSLMRDLTNHVTTGENGQAVLAANIPLLRGAGHVAYESRYQAERDLIYAVRTFERFRQTLAVSIAGDYFALQRLKQEIVNVTASLDQFSMMVDEATARWQIGLVLELDVQRAEQDRLDARNRQVVAVETYKTAVEEFKIRLGMPLDTPIDIEPLQDPGEEPAARSQQGQAVRLESAIRMPQTSAEEAVRLAHKYRLDLLNVLDFIDDRRRGVDIARNNLLPSLDLQGSVTFDTNPDRLNMVDYHDDRATWRSALNLELPLDRKEERNELRSSLIRKARAQRNYEEARDQVAVQVRQAMRNVLQSRETLDIQLLSRELAVRRRQGARLRFEQGFVGNRDIVEAENALLRARNALALAQVQYRLAVLEFLRDTGMLRLDDEGQWVTPAAGPGS